MKEVIAYAAARHIDMIPEIDMPGHMMAAIKAYPYLSCEGGSTWGALFTTPICPCNEKTFEFAENVYSEIFAYSLLNMYTSVLMRWKKAAGRSHHFAKV
nr:family 20 glycosylhydrolase [Chitinophaga pinensis]